MVESVIAKLKISPQEFNNYSQPPGIDLVKLEEGPDYFVIAFVSSDLFPQKHLRNTEDSIRHEILYNFKGRIIDENMRTHPNLPHRLFKLETMLDHPSVTTGAPRELKMATEAATETHDIELTREQFQEIEYDKESGQRLQPKRVIRKPRMITERTSEGRTVTREDPNHIEEVYVTPFGVIDIG